MVPGFEHEILRPQTGVLPMNYTHPPDYTLVHPLKTQPLFLGQCRKPDILSFFSNYLLAFHKLNLHYWFTIYELTQYPFYGQVVAFRGAGSGSGVASFAGSAGRAELIF